MNCELLPSLHMLDRMFERGISYVEVKETILRGKRKHREDCCMIAKYKLFGVVYRQQPCHYFGITTYYIKGV